MARQHQPVTCSLQQQRHNTGLLSLCCHSIALPCLGGNKFLIWPLHLSVQYKTSRSILLRSVLCTRIELTNTTTANMRKWVTSIHNFCERPVHTLVVLFHFLLHISETQGDSLMQFHNRSLVGFLILLHKETIATVAIALILQAELL